VLFFLSKQQHIRVVKALHVDFKRMLDLNPLNIATVPLLSFIFLKQLITLFDLKFTSIKTSFSN